MADSYALDANVFIVALRNPARLARLKRFLLRAGPRTRVHAVVAMELRAGVRTEAHAAAIEALIAPYATRDRVIVPSFEAFVQAGRVLSALAMHERGPSASHGLPLAMDALIASSCREASSVLVTENMRHFAAIQRHLRGFRFLDADAALGVTDVSHAAKAKTR